MFNFSRFFEFWVFYTEKKDHVKKLTSNSYSASQNTPINNIFAIVLRKILKFIFLPKKMEKSVKKVGENWILGLYVKQ